MSWSDDFEFDAAELINESDIDYFYDVANTTDIDAEANQFDEDVNEDEYDDEDDEDDDIDDELEDDAIDNSNISYENNNICFKLNSSFGDARNKLSLSEEILCKNFKNVKNIESENRLQEIIDNVFQEGFRKSLYIRNLTFEKSGRDLVLGIRPDIIEGDYLYELLGEGNSLLFKGRVFGKEFIVDAIYETAHTERLDFEVDCVAIPYSDPSRISWNFLYDLQDRAESLTEYTSEKLNEWKEYLRWKKELARKQIFGCKYYKVTFDESKHRLIFWLVCEGQEYFKAFKKYLYKDIQAFNNDYSEDKWIFELAKTDNKRRFDRSIELGRFKGIVKEYYLNEQSSFSMEDYMSAPIVDYDDMDNSAYEDENISEQQIFLAFENPYIVQVAYDLNRNDLDYINTKGFEDEEIIDYVYENVLGNYYENGFLALSAVGEFVLINRFEKAIQQLELDEHYSPNLAMWLFNVNHARLPEDSIDIVIDKWLNKNIENNENQKQAVYKMLKAPDLCLIQGPPGTGKTTVIAEAIYQFVCQGNRVLLASQSNDAVDNALERLAESPEIRAIRLGQKGKRKKKANEEVSKKFSEDEALKYYYKALSTQISNTWINKWNRLEERILECSTDIRDITMYLTDVQQLNETYSDELKELAHQQENVNKLKTTERNIIEQNTSINNERWQYQLFVKYLYEPSDNEFSLSADQIDIVYNEVVNAVKYATSSDIKIVSRDIQYDLCDLNGKNLYIKFLLENLSVLEELKNKLIESQKVLSNDNDVLDVQIKSLKEKMTTAYLEDDEDKANEIKKQLKDIQKERDLKRLSSSVVSLADNEKELLSFNLIEKINFGEKHYVINLIENIANEFKCAFDNAEKALGRFMESRIIKSIDDISDRIKAEQGKLQLQEEKVKNISAQISSKSSTIERLGEKYSVETPEATVIVENIKSVKKDLEDELEREQVVRSNWENVLVKLKERLEDSESYIYDKTYYQETYINACNVIGISCTDNMRNLTEKGYNDFDVVIIDEVSKATPPELLIPLMKARKAILVGDHRQLPPMFDEHEGSYNELINNQERVPEELQDILTAENFQRFKKMVTASLFKDYFEKADESIKHSLLTQYRMHSDISAIINRFYEQRLCNGNTAIEENKTKNHNLTIKGADKSQFIVPEKHAYWIDSSTLPNGEPIYETYIHNSTSACNILEKHIIIELLKKIADEYKKQGYSEKNKKTVGVISFYQMQVNELRDAFKKIRKEYDFSAIEVDINTVDRFQGKEKNIIITSLVRNNKESRASKHIVAFERINVAFSRAQELLVIVGARHMYEHAKIELPNMDMPGFKTVPAYQNIMEDLNRKACFKGSEKIITPDLEQTILQEYKEVRNIK